MYAITGITGRVGSAAAQALLLNGAQVRAVVRDAAKGDAWAARGADAALADFHDETALATAFSGVEGVFIMIPPNFAPTPGFPESRAIVATLRTALEAARPPRIVVLSSVGAQHDSGLGLITQLHILEQELGSLPMPIAFLRPAWFMENSHWDIGPARERGEMPSFLQPLDRPFRMVATEDIGNVAAEVLQQEWSGKRIVEIEGPMRYSQNDLAAAFASALNKPVKAVIVPRSAWESLFASQGGSPESIAPRIEMLDGFNSGWIDFEGGPETEHVRGTRTQKEVFQDLLRKAGYRVTEG